MSQIFLIISIPRFKNVCTKPTVFSYESNAVMGELGSHVHYIAIPPLLYYGTQSIHKQVIEEVRNGDKLISLAISELTGGSDVAQLKTTAVKDGKGNYIVNGNKCMF